MKFHIILISLITLVYGLPSLGRLNNPLEKHPSQRLIKLGPSQYEVVDEATKLNYKRRAINFIDVSDHISIEDAMKQNLIEKTPEASWLDSIITYGSKKLDEIVTPKNYSYPANIKYQDKVNQFIGQIDTDLMFENLSKFSSFFTRYYKSETGVESAEWLESKLIEVIGTAKDSVHVKRIHHDTWDQFSLIISIPGKVDSKVIVGAHQDSMNLLFPNLMKSPGADDDGSGTVTILEALRILMIDYQSGDFKPYQTLEFHFYSAEEGGLLGSYDVYKRYYENNETVMALLQQDMTGYTGNMNKDDIHMGLIGDYTSPKLNDFIKMIIDNYCDIPYHETTCGYACSDHASAIEHGYPASFVIESEMSLTSKYIHSVMDTIDRLDWDHIKEHTKLTVAFAYELSMAKIDEA